MLQIRINNVAVCHIHKEMLDKVSKENILNSLSWRMSTGSMCLVLTCDKRRQDSIEGWLVSIWRDGIELIDGGQ